MKALARWCQVQIFAVDQKIGRETSLELVTHRTGGEQFIQIDQRVRRVDLQEELLIVFDELGEALLRDARDLGELHLKARQETANEVDHVRSQRVVDELLDFDLKLVDRTGRTLFREES